MAAPRSGRLASLGCVVLLTVASAALFAPAFRPGWDFLGISPAIVPPWRTAGGPSGVQDASQSDALVFTWPNLHHWTESVRNDWTGLLWNPRILCGSPFLATQDTFALYPSNLLAFCGGLPTFLLWTSLLHVALANVGAWLALRRLALSRTACLFGAWSFGAGSWFLAHLDVVNFPQAAAWLPWILFAADRAQVERRSRDRLLLGACVALSVFAGMIQITLITLLLAVVFGRVRAETQARRDGNASAWRGVGSVGLGIAAGLLLAGPQLLPLAEWSRDSSRVRDAGDVQRFAYRPLEWLHLLVPEILGSPAEISRWVQPVEPGRPESALLPPTSEASYPPARFAGARVHGATFLESVCSPLAIGLVLALVALTRPRRATALFLAIATTGALLAMATPVLTALATTPLGTFANPRRLLLLCAVGFSGLAALGAEHLLAAARRSWITAVPAVLLVGWLLLTWLFPDTIADALATGGDEALARKVPAILLRQAIAPAAILVLGAAFALLRPTARWRAPALATLAVADALLFNARNNPSRPHEPVFPETAVTRFVAERMSDEIPPTPIPIRYEDPIGPPCRVARFRSAEPGVPPPLPPNLGMLFGFRDQQGYEGILPRRLEELLEVIEPGIVFEHHAVAEWRDAAAFQRPCVDLLGFRYVLSVDDEIPNLYTIRQFPEELCAVFGNAGFIPRVTAVTRARVFERPGDLLGAISSPAFDPATEVLLLRSDLAGRGPEPDENGAIAFPAPQAGESVRWTQRGCATAEVEASLSGPRFLVVSESYHPGWKAEDEHGSSLPLLPANHAFQAVFLPAGQTRFRVTFAPKSVILGVGMCVLGALVLLADTMLRRRIVSGPVDKDVQ